MKYYKLLSQDLTSFKNTKWQIGVPITVNEAGNEMCSNRVLHCYNHPMLAVIFNPIHANITDPKLFEIEVDEICNTDGLKFASKSQTLLREISIPEITTEQKIEFAIKVSKLVYKNEKWNLWADKWLDGSDRTAYVAYSTADAAAYSTADAAADTAADAAYYTACTANAANAAYYAANAAADTAADAAYYTACTACTANAAYYAAYAAYYAADAAASKNEFNQKMIEIIESIFDEQKS